MQHIVNEERIERGARIGKIAMFAGLAFLVGGLVISLALPAYIWASFASLVLGLVVSSIGTMNMNRWVREPRADQALAQGLKGFDDRYCLYSYLLPAPHVLLSPKGLYVLTAQGQEGKIRYEGEQFKRDFSVGRLFRWMADEGLGQPLRMANAEVEAMREFLDEHEVGQEVEIHNILVFYHPKAELEVGDIPRPVVDPKGLKNVIRKQIDDKLPQRQYRQIEDLFDEVSEVWWEGEEDEGRS